MKVILGDNIILDCDAALFVNGTEVFRLRKRESDGRLMCDFDVRNKNGARIAKVANNNVVYAAEGYEVHQLPGESNIQDTDGQFLARVRETSHDEIRITGEYWVDGLQVLISDDGLRSGGNLLSGNTVMGFGKAISIESNSLSIGIR